MESKQVSMLFHQNYKISLEYEREPQFHKHNHIQLWPIVRIQKKENFMFPYIRSATILNTNTTTNKIPIHLMNLNATLIPK